MQFQRMFLKKKNRDATRENRKREDKKRSSKRIRHTENDIERENRKKNEKKRSTNNVVHIRNRAWFSDSFGCKKAPCTMLAKMALDSDETNNVRKFNTKTLKNRNHTGVY